MIFYRRASLGQTDVTRRLWVSPGSAHFPSSVCPSDTDIRFPPAFYLHVLFSDRSPAHNLSAFQWLNIHFICTEYVSIFLLVSDAYLFIPSFLLVFICMKIYSPSIPNPQSLFFFLSLKSFFICRIFPFMLPVKRRKSEDCRSAILLFCHSVLLCCFALLFCHSVFPCLPFSSPL